MTRHAPRSTTPDFERSFHSPPHPAPAAPDHGAPGTLHLGGENVGALSAILFQREGDRVRSVIFAGFGEAIALRELGVHDSVVVYTGPDPI